MERIVPNRHSRRNSTGNLCFEHTGYKEVLSRYLQPPFASCHNNCKHQFPDHPLEFKPAPPPLEKSSSKPPATSKKLYAPIPRPSTKDVKISKTSLLKHQIKPAPIESKTQDFKSKIKSKPDLDDPFYLPPSRLTRRYSEVIIPTTGLGDVIDSPAVGGGLTKSSKTIQNKTEPRKNPNPPNSLKAKTPENNGKISRKVQALKDQFSSTVDQGPRKSKPVKPGGEVVQEKINKADKIQSQNNGITASEVKKTENRIQKKDETLQRDGQKNGITALEIKKTEKKIQTPASGSSKNDESVSGNSSSKKDETL